MVSWFANSVQHKASDLLANGIMATGIFTGSIFLACDELLRVEELVGGTHVNFINNYGFWVNKNCPRHRLASASL